jgi:D-xylose transport system substrate-binding protein
MRRTAHNQVSASGGSIGALALFLALLGACAGAAVDSEPGTPVPAGQDDVSGDAGNSQDGGEVLAFLLPETKTARYERHDRPAFVERLAALCPDCEAIVHNAGHDAARQQAQAEAAITNGADVLVLDPVDAVSAGVIARHAERSGVPVVTYDRMLFDAPVAFHVTFDNERVGHLQAQSLVRAMGERRDDDGWVVMLNGAATDANAAEFRRGANRVFEAHEVRIGAEVDVRDWSPELAQEAMEQAIATLGREHIVGVYSANDALAGAAIAAMRAAGIDPLPPVTGQDAELAAVRRVLAGEQHMTVHKSFRTQGSVAAEVALALARQGEIPAGVATSTIDNGHGPVPALRLTPRVVTRDTIAETVVADGLWRVEDICRDGLEAACVDVGLQ